MAHINLTREADAIADRAGQRRLHRQAGARPRRRPAQPAVPGAADRALPAAGGAGDEPRDVGAPGDAAQLRPARAPTARPCSARAAATRPAARSATAACSKPVELLRRADRLLPAQAARRQARADHRRADLRADRSGARPHQPVERQDGLRDRARRRRGRRRRDAGRRPGAPADAARRAAHRRHARAREMHDAVLPRRRAQRRLRRHRRGRRLARRRRRRARRSRRTAGQGRADASS